MARNNHIWIFWVPAHKGVQGSEVVDGIAKEAAGGQTDGVVDRVRWQTSLPHLVRRATERRSAAAAQWASDHVRPERRYLPPEGGGFRKRALRRVQRPRPSAIINCYRATQRSAPSSMTECRALSIWSQTSVGATEVGGSRGFICSSSAESWPLRLGRFERV